MRTAPDRSRRASPAKTKLEGCLNDAGLSRRLLVLGDSDIIEQANIPPLRAIRPSFPNPWPASAARELRTSISPPRI